MGNIVENPIINSPFEEPKEYWDFSEGTSKIVEKRRPSGYMLPVGKRRKDQLAILATEEFQEMELVNRIRERVKNWRGKYSGVTKITKELLNYWQSEEREKKLFFAQMEAAETAIWLIEAPANETADIKRQINASREYETLPRYALKMATASGKTVVMAMIIAWQVLNKIYNRKDKRFSDAVLVVCPNLTVKERLQVLYPSNEDNYYSKFDLVPPSLLPLLGQGKYFVTNWHLFEPKDDSNTRGVVKKGEESNNAFVRRVLKDLGSKRNILVINDEAHHCYRCNPEGVQSTKKKKISKDIREQNEQATVWVEGLERVQKVREVNLCFDFSATPFYISGSGYQEGTPFPWIMSDFGITDAIECGIIKIPRVPVEDNYAGREPKYLNLWEQIKDKLPKKALKDEDVLKQTSRMLSEVDGALKMLSSQWKETFDEWQGEERKIPPCMIVVCNNTGASRIIADYIGGANGRSCAIFKELENNEENEYTLRLILIF
jgi:type III restriction enzyme